MTKEEIALELTLAKLDKLKLDKTGNEHLANEIAKIFNTIYKNLDLPSDK